MYLRTSVHVNIMTFKSGRNERQSCGKLGEN